MPDILNYGGGRQTVCIVTLILRGELPKPDRIICADTGRENPTTWDYLDRWVTPALKQIGLSVEVIPPKTVYDLWSGTGETILIPVWLANGKMSSFCSGMWKRDRMDTYLRSTGISSGTRWIGFATDERKRIDKLLRSERAPQWKYRFPLTEFCLDSRAACDAVESFGWPLPEISACWLCPLKHNREWRIIRDVYPDLFAEACRIDAEIREEDRERGGSGMWLHHSLVPLSEANLNADDSPKGVRQCSLSMCMI